MNVLKVACSAIPVILTTAGMFYTPLAVAAGPFAFISVAVVVAKLVQGKRQTYKGTQKVELVQVENKSFVSCGTVNSIAS